MKKMVLDTIIIYLIGIGIVIGIACLGALIDGVLGGFFFAIAGGYFTLAIISVIVGFRASSNKCDINTAVIISIVIPTIFLFFMRYDMMFITILEGSSLLILVLTSFALGKSINFTKGRNIFLHSSAVVVATFVIFIIFYLISAYQSTWSWVPLLPQELFFVQPQNSIVTFHGERNENNDYVLYNDDTNEPFTGKIISYKKRLNLNFFTKNAGGISYYIEGYLFGYSGDVIRPGRYNSWYGTYEYFDEWKYDMSNKSNQKYLLHNSYKEIIEKEFPKENMLYYAEKEYVDINGDLSNLPKIIIIYDENNKLVRKEITFQKNGVIDRIDFYSVDKGGWNYYNSFFDNLGFSRYSNYDFNQKRIWNTDEFLKSDFDAYKYIKRVSNSSSLKLDTPSKMVYVPYPEKWEDDGNLTDNLIAVFGFPITTVSWMFLNSDNKFEYILNSDGNDILSLIGRSTLKLNYLETDNDIDNFKRSSIHFRINSENGNKRINLYFKEGKFLIENGPYYLDLISDKKGDSEEDISLRNKLYQKFRNLEE